MIDKRETQYREIQHFKNATLDAQNDSIPIVSLYIIVVVGLPRVKWDFPEIRSGALRIDRKKIKELRGDRLKKLLGKMFLFN